MPPPYVLLYDQQYLDDLAQIDAFDIPMLRDALVQLQHQAEVQARNRRPLAAPLSWCPTATWQLRIRGYRVLYRVDDGVVGVLRLRFKGSLTTEEMGP